MISAVLWDFGGVITSSPFEAFNTLEASRGLPLGIIRQVNSTNPEHNAWARLERSEVSAAEFSDLFHAESMALGHPIHGADVLAVLEGAVRPEMVTALERVIAADYKTACLTNNFNSGRNDAIADQSSPIGSVMAKFDLIVESRVIGIRKPEIGFYEYACNTLGVPPGECVFLDDIGSNLKTAAAMGMTTIKVLNADQAITDLESVLGISLR